VSSSPRARHKRPSEGGQERGEETRVRIIQAALDVFGERGFDGASTREIAARAGVNAPALQYYFDNKAGVYAACGAYIAAYVHDPIAPALEAARTALAGQPGRAALIDTYCALQAAVAGLLLDSPAPPRWSQFMSREQSGLEQKQTAAFDAIYTCVIAPLHAAQEALLGRIMRRGASAEEVRIRMLMLNGQLAAFHAQRRAALRTLGWDAPDAAQRAELKRLLDDQTRALLGVL
jgi:AcrR family transcriptional regulator